MGRFPRAVTLADAFRIILRARYSARPALADEIRSYAWFWYDANLPKEEVAVAKEALNVLKEGVANGKIRLRGALDLSLPPQDIDPADARSGELHVFPVLPRSALIGDGRLEVSLNNKVVRTYRQVHCYETDLRPRAKPSAVSRAKPTSDADFATFARNYLANGGRTTERAFAQAAKGAGINATRHRLRSALPARRRGRPNNSPKN
jgi:hypothetical protein